MRKRSTFFSVVTALIASATIAVAQTPSTPAAPAIQTPAPAASTTASGINWEGAVTFGGIGTSTDGYQGRVAEYTVTDEDALAAIRFMTWGENGGFRYDVSVFNGGDARNQRYAAYLDFSRLVKARVTYRQFPHRLDHDPLTYVDGGSPLGGTFIVRHTDTDPGAAYRVGYGEFDAGVDLNLRNVQFFLGHRRETRSGWHQALTTAHCANCHVVGFSQKMDELTSDLTAGARAHVGPLALEYTFLNRNTEDSADPIQYTYDDAVQPATLQDIFTNRVQYDAGSGPLPVSADPEIRKYSNTLRARFGLPGNGAIYGNFTQSSTKNETQGLSYDYTGAFGRFFLPIGRWASLRADFRRYSIDNDSVFVNVIEPVAVAGLAAGKTYSEAFPNALPATFDFTRESSLNRTPTELGVEFGVRPAKRTFLRFGYGWQEVERDYFEVEKTTTNTIYVAGRSQMGIANARFRFQYEDINDPFLYKHAAWPEILQPYMSPGNSPLTGLQYYSMYESRQADLTAFPTKNAFFEGAVTFAPNARTAITAHYRWRDAQNDELNAGLGGFNSEWGRTVSAPGVDVWIGADDHWALTAGYTYNREELDTMFSTLAFNG
ncbi:MAG: hypothetical protein H6Q08_1613 [Acidobacteria bacterium]|nr:hypothetical protein [Acidobacteriota bacterium]